MKIEPFLINPHDETCEVNANMTLAELKYMHGLLADNFENMDSEYNTEEDDKPTDYSDSLLLKLHEIIVNKMKENEAGSGE